jgi:hypothetical protein
MDTRKPRKAGFRQRKKIRFWIPRPAAQACPIETREEEQKMKQMKRYVIERDIPGIGQMSLTELCGAARASNQALDQIGSNIQWQHSYVAGDKTFCIYLADSEDAIRQHAELSGIPVGAITEVPQIIDPLTANN